MSRILSPLKKYYREMSKIGILERKYLNHIEALRDVQRAKLKAAEGKCNPCIDDGAPLEGSCTECGVLFG